MGRGMNDWLKTKDGRGETHGDRGGDDGFRGRRRRRECGREDVRRGEATGTGWRSEEGDG